MKYENTFKAIDQILWKEQGCGSELDYLEKILNLSITLPNIESNILRTLKQNNNIYDYGN